MIGRSISVEPSNPGTVVRDVRPQERAQRVAPPRRSRRTARRAAPPRRARSRRRCGSIRIWQREREGVHRRAVGLRERGGGADRRHRGVGLGAGAEHLEASEPAHRASLPHAGEERVHARRGPRGRRRSRARAAQVADELVAGVDRHEEALAAASPPRSGGPGTPRRRAPAWPAAGWRRRRRPTCRAAAATRSRRPGSGRRHATRRAWS